HLISAHLLGEHHEDGTADVLYVEWTVARRDLRILECGGIERQRIEVGVERFDSPNEIRGIQDVLPGREGANGQASIYRPRRGHFDYSGVRIHRRIPGRDGSGGAREGKDGSLSWRDEEIWSTVEDDPSGLGIAHGRDGDLQAIGR